MKKRLAVYPLVALAAGLAWLLSATLFPAAADATPLAHQHSHSVDDQSYLPAREAPKVVEIYRQELKSIQPQIKEAESADDDGMISLSEISEIIPDDPDGYHEIKLWSVLYQLGRAQELSKEEANAKRFNREAMQEFAGNFRAYTEMRKLYSGLESEQRELIGETLDAQGRAIHGGEDPDEFSAKFAELKASERPGFFWDCIQGDNGGIGPEKHWGIMWEVSFAEFPNLKELLDALESIKPWRTDLEARAQALFF